MAASQRRSGRTNRIPIGHSGGPSLVVGLPSFASQSCPPGQTANKKRQCSCPARTDPCLTGCFDKKHDTANCGACGNACPADTACVKGACRCPAGGCTTITPAPSVCTIDGNPICTGETDVCAEAGCYCRPNTEGTTFCGPKITCIAVAFCQSSADCEAGEPGALKTCCGGEPGTECCPVTGGLCIPTCGGGNAARSAGITTGLNTSPPSGAGL